MTQWRILPGTEALAREASETISRAAREAIETRGRFSLVLAGGRTPCRTYELLCETRQAWSSWSLYYGDERCLPADHPQRNSRMVGDTGLAQRVEREYPIPAELGAEAAAQAYSETIRDVLPFDMVLLGMGEDGHTASLFPGGAWSDVPGAIPVHDAPKPPPDRVSLSAGALQSCNAMLVLVSGAGKRAALHAWRSGQDLPVARVAGLPQATVLVESPLWEDAA